MTATFSCERIQLDPQYHLGNAGIIGLYPIDGAAWLWHEDAQAQFVDFKLELDLKKELKCVISLSADQRYSFYIDGQRVSRGPDRGDIEHWSFASYQISLPAGKHILSASVWHVGEHAPLAQISYNPGFICHADGEGHELISTGEANWQASKQNHISFQGISIPYYIAIGDSSIVDCNKLIEAEWSDASVVRKTLVDSSTGVATLGWKLCPSTLPEQVDRYVSPGSIRAVTSEWNDKEPMPSSALNNNAINQWQAIISGDGVTVPANSDIKVLWDLDEYYCAYPHLQWSGGKGARIHVEWAESLYNSLEIHGEGYRRDLHKGNRNDLDGKIWLGFGDSFIGDGQQQSQQTFWWRAGRYILLHITTKDEALELSKIELNETRYPLEYQGSFSCNEESIQPIIDLSVRGMQMCSHETYMDCPYYEQLMYVGDTRLEMLCTHIMDADDRLVKRGIELFDWSRVNWGFINERYPSHWPQHSPTFSLIWVSLLHDFAYWRDDAEWIQARLIGMRSMLEHFEPYVDENGLLNALPGWSFMDWVDEWDTGYPPDGRWGCSGIVNLLYLMTLRKAADLENHFGESILSQRYGDKSKTLCQNINKAFWNDDRKLFADNLAHSEFSEHAQCLALLSNAVADENVDDCLQALLSEADLKRCTVYFSYYLFETLYKFGKESELHAKYSFWKNLHDLGMRTPVESPEPSRSDCHAWGSHPLHHLHASVVGVRPASPGFKRVHIAPLIGQFDNVRCVTPHPAGEITVTYTAGKWGIDLPKGLEGVFEIAGKTHSLSSGSNSVES